MKKDITLDSDKFFEILDAAFNADYAKVRRASSELARAFADSGDDVVAGRLRSLIRRKGVPLQTSGVQQTLPVDGGSRLPLVDEEPWPTKPIFLNADTKATLDGIVADVENYSLLGSKGLLTRFGLMLSGPPGTGKSLLAGHLAARLKRPFLIARLDSLISSRLGETAKNIRQIFEFVPAKGAVLFLDEIDAIAKMRDDRQELGELKRVVNTVIQGLDSLDDQAVVVAATNHPQLLDPAIWRRFPYRCEIEAPDFGVREALWSYFLYEDHDEFRDRARVLAGLSDGLSGADIETLALGTRRSALLKKKSLPEPQLLLALMQSSPQRPKALHDSKLTITQRRELVRFLGSLEGVNIKKITSMLGMSRSQFYNYMKA